MFFLFHFQIIIEESTYFKGGGKQGNERETRKKEKRNENEKERTSLSCF
jgi:hypothetical protein